MVDVHADMDVGCIILRGAGGCACRITDCGYFLGQLSLVGLEHLDRYFCSWRSVCLAYAMQYDQKQTAIIFGQPR